MKTNRRLLFIVAVLCLAIMIPAATAMSYKIKLGAVKQADTGDTALTLIAGGNTSGTHEISVTQAEDGTLGTVTDRPVSSQSTHGSYLAPNGILYVNTYLAGPGGNYGLLKYKKDPVTGNWIQIGFDAATVSASSVITNGGALADGTAGTGNTISGALTPVASAASAVPPAVVPVGMFCSTKLMTKHEDPDTGVLEVGDNATGLNYFYSMANGSWNAVLGSTATVCDIAFRESMGNDEAWSTGHSNNILHFTDAANAKYGIQPVLDPKGSRLGAATMAHTNRTFTLDNTEYVVWSDGSAGGDLVFIKTSDNSNAGRFHIFSGIDENHSVALNIAGDGATGSINGIVPNYADGSLTGVQISHNDDGSLNVAIKNNVAGTGTAFDICGLDVVSSNGEWRNN